MRTHGALLHPENLAAEPPHIPHVVRDEQHGFAGGDQPAQRFERPPPERGIADRQHFIDQHDVGPAMDGNRETEPRIQARRVALHRRVDQPLDVGEVDDLVEPLIDLLAGQAKQAAAQVDVLAAGQLGMKTRAQFDQRHDVAGDAHLAAGRPGDARDQLQQRGLAGAIAADDAQPGAFGHLERHVPERVDGRADLPARRAVHVVASATQPVQARGDQVDHGARAAGAVALAGVFELNGDGH